MVTSRRGRHGAARGSRRRRLGAVLAIGAASVLVALTLIAEPMRIESGSMAPTLSAGDRVLVDKRAYRESPPQRGDLVVFAAPGSRETMLKRVVAVGGDSVAIEDGRLVVNGVVQRERYTDPEAVDSVYFGPAKVHPRHVFVLGDNRANSEDSRSFGAVPQRDVIGRAGARLWPPARWGEIR
jgi:signal peptidase I